MGKTSKAKANPKKCGSRMPLKGNNLKKVKAMTKKVEKLLKSKCVSAGVVGLTTNLKTRKNSRVYKGFDGHITIGEAHSCRVGRASESFVIKEVFDDPKIKNKRIYTGWVPAGRRNYTIYFAYKLKRGCSAA